jgi:hypothetical protein
MRFANHTAPPQTVANNIQSPLSQSREIATHLTELCSRVCMFFNAVSRVHATFSEVQSRATSPPGLGPSRFFFTALCTRRSNRRFASRDAASWSPDTLAPARTHARCGKMWPARQFSCQRVKFKQLSAPIVTYENEGRSQTHRPGRTHSPLELQRDGHDTQSPRPGR